MATAALSNVTHEKGWGTFFDVNYEGREYRFSVNAQTLQTRGMSSRTKKTFPEVFATNIPILLRAAQMLIESGRIERKTDIGGTEILPTHITEVRGG